MSNNFFFKELKKRVGKPTKLSIISEREEGREFFYVYCRVLNVDDEAVVVKTKWGLKQIPISDIREVQDTILNYKDDGV